MRKTEHEAHPELVEAARALLEGVHWAWTDVAGQLHTFRDEDLLDEGRARHWQDIEPNEPIDEKGEDAGEDADEADYPRAEDYRFWATSSPWRLRLERLRQDPPPAEGGCDRPPRHGH